MKITIKILKLVILGIIASSCAREWLDEKSDKSLVIPTSLKDLQALLDNSSVMNSGRVPNLGEISADDYVVPAERWPTLSSWEKNAYLWRHKIFDDRDGEENWNNSYQQIFYANLVLEGVRKVEIGSANQKEFNNVKGSALFYRAFSYFNLAQVFCAAYDNASSSLALGLPLRNSTSLEIELERANLEVTYQFMLNDLLEAKTLLPDRATFATRPSRAAAFALLAKIYLIMGEYEKSYSNADSCLQIYPELIDFNDLQLTSNYPIARYNKEVIYHATMQIAPIITATRLNVAPGLLSLYEDNDLRYASFFRTVGANVTFKGSYNGSSTLFAGLSTNEVYLIKSEALARLNQDANSLQVLNNLLSHRYSEYTTVDIINNSEIVDLIITERRKELPFRGVRWSDLKRLNLQLNHQSTLFREADGEIYSLSPNSSRYVLPIPDLVVNLSTGIKQNERN